MRDFLGPVITRLSTAFESIDPILDFLTFEGMPIISLLFGRTTYVTAPGTFGGEDQVGDFAGAAIAIRALADGGPATRRRLCRGPSRGGSRLAAQLLRLAGAEG